MEHVSGTRQELKLVRANLKMPVPQAAGDVSGVQEKGPGRDVPLGMFGTHVVFSPTRLDTPPRQDTNKKRPEARALADCSPGPSAKTSKPRSACWVQPHTDDHPRFHVGPRPQERSPLAVLFGGGGEYVKEAIACLQSLPRIQLRRLGGVGGFCLKMYLTGK